MWTEKQCNGGVVLLRDLLSADDRKKIERFIDESGYDDHYKQEQ